MKKTYNLAFAVCFSVLLISCKQHITTYAENDSPPVNDTIRSLKITWDTVAGKISHDVYFAEYGRVRRIAGDTLMLVYQFGPKGKEWNAIAFRKSFDNGKTWLPEKTFQPKQKYYEGSWKYVDNWYHCGQGAVMGTWTIEP